MPPRENVKLVGTVADHLLRDFLTRVDQPYEWLDEETGRDLLARHGVARAELPVVVLDDELVLVTPTLEELADALGIRVPPKATDYRRRDRRRRPGGSGSGRLRGVGRPHRRGRRARRTGRPGRLHLADREPDFDC
jgi:hypothetical protein